MKKNGFTLIELVTVIALLSIVGVILIPKISDMFQTSKADQLEEVRQEVVTATEVYLNSSCGSDSYDKLIENDSIKIYLSSISNCGLIENKIYNPVSGEYFDIDNEYVDVIIDEVGMIDYTLSF